MPATVAVTIPRPAPRSATAAASCFGSAGAVTGGSTCSTWSRAPKCPAMAAAMRPAWYEHSEKSVGNTSVRTPKSLIVGSSGLKPLNPKVRGDPTSAARAPAAGSSAQHGRDGTALADQEHGDVRLTQHLLRDGAEQQAPDPAPSVSAHRDEVGAGGAGRGEDLRVGPPHARLPGHIDAAGSQPAGYRREVILGIALELRQIAGDEIPRTLDGHRRGRLEDPHEHHGHVEGARDLQNERHDALADFGAVERHENTLIHRSPPPRRSGPGRAPICAAEAAKPAWSSRAARLRRRCRAAGGEGRSGRASSSR